MDNNASEIKHNNSALEEHSVEFDKIQKHLMLKIGASGVKLDPLQENEEQMNNQYNQDNIMTDREDQVEPSARIDRQDIDGGLNLKYNMHENNIIQEEVIVENIDESYEFGQ